MKPNLLLGAVAFIAASLCTGAADAAPRAKAKPAPRAAAAPDAGLTLAFGVGGGWGDVEYKDALGRESSESGPLGVFNVRVNAYIGPLTVGARYLQDTEQRESPREKAALIGLRFPNSPVSILVGRGVVDNADDDVPDDIEVTSWELLIAPHGKQIQFSIQGAEGDASYAAFVVSFVLGNQ